MATDPRMIQFLAEEAAFRTQRDPDAVEDEETYQIAGMGRVVTKAVGKAVGKAPPVPTGRGIDELNAAKARLPNEPLVGPLEMQQPQPPKSEGGLEFPKEEAEARRALKVKQAPDAVKPHMPRMVVKAPKAKKGEKQLPDFVVGDITPDDWVKRVTAILDPAQIMAAKTWYRDVFDTFLLHTDGDKEMAKRLMRAWLVANQNIGVAGAMGNALLQGEQIARGVPEAKMVGGGMPNPTHAARRVLKDEPIDFGVGQKIADFVDSAEGKDVRSWMGNNLEGGRPFVVDIHTARDTGLVDEVLINHLDRAGYDTRELKAAQVKWLADEKEAHPKTKAKDAYDFGDSITAPRYESRAAFGMELTAHLNDIKWLGRSDWRPEEVQAIGWMGMTKLTGGKAEDSVDALVKNRRALSYEADAGEGSPWARKYGKRFYALDETGQRAVTERVTGRATEMVESLTGIYAPRVVHGSGGWGAVDKKTGQIITGQNPSTVAQTLTSRRGSEQAAHVLGYLLQQTEVWVNTLKTPTKNPKGFVVDLISTDPNTIMGTDAGIKALWDLVKAADTTKLVGGYQPHVSPDGRLGIRIVIKKGGQGTHDKLAALLADDGPVAKALDKFTGGKEEIDASLIEADIYVAKNDWKKDKNGQVHVSRLTDEFGRGIKSQLDTLRKELEQIYDQALRDAEAAQSGGQR